MISQQEVLRKTNGGIRILSYLVLLDHPVQEGLKVSYPDCGNWPNPFDDYRRTLHVTNVKEDPEAKLSYYIARYHDESGHIPDGTAIDFARHFWGLQNQALLERINKELNLKIGVEFDFYDHSEPATVVETPREEPVTTPEPSEGDASVTKEPVKTITEWPKFSFFRRPIKNVLPCKEVTVPDVYRYLTSDYAATTTAQLRSITNEDTAKEFKGKSFDYCTPAGVFSKRANSALVTPSGLMVIDIDDLKNYDEVESVFHQLLENRRLQTELLFRSPSGHGLKWFIRIVNNEGHDHRFFFLAVQNYLKTLGIVVDPSGKDVSRSCYLPHDPAAFINKMYL